MINIRSRLFQGIVVCVLFCVPVLASAAEFRSGDQPSFAAHETLDGDLYIAGGGVTSAGSVNGDVMAAGGNVIISGAVAADLVAGGGTVVLLNDVGDDVRVAGGTVILQGAVRGDVIVAGGQLTIGGAGIEGDVVAGGGIIRIDAPVGGDVRIGGGEVTINAPIAGNVHIRAERITLGSGAVIQGDFRYTAFQTVTMEEGAVVRGETYFTERPRAQKATASGLAAAAAIWVSIQFLVLLFSALVIGLAFRPFAQKLVQTATTRPFQEIGRGAIFIIVAPIAFVVMLFTIVGIPFGVVGLLGYGASLIATCLLTPIIVGSFFHRWAFKRKTFEVSWKTIVIGAAAYVLLGLIPFIGWAVQFGVWLLTIGSLVRIKWDVMKQWRSS